MKTIAVIFALAFAFTTGMAVATVVDHAVLLLNALKKRARSPRGRFARSPGLARSKRNSLFWTFRHPLPE